MMNFSQRLYPYPLGVQSLEEKGKKGLFVSYVPKDLETKECGVVLFDRKTGEEVGKYPFSAEQKIGIVYYQTILGVDSKNISYLFYEGDKLWADRRAKGFAGVDSFGAEKAEADYKAVVDERPYDWGADMLPKLKYEDCVAYCLHVRGFTRHNTSGVRGKGTFTGIVEKLAYLKDLGITTIELQPAYEFNELPKAEERKIPNKKVLVKDEQQKLNYWGYKEGFYYTPKRSYAKSNNASKEFKDMVKASHENGMEVVMQFYFPENFVQTEILEILRFWHMIYHVDGFHLMGSQIPVKQIAEDAFLKECKLWYYDFPTGELYPNAGKVTYRNLASYNDCYMYDMRRFLKGDEGCVSEAMKHMRSNPAYSGRINYLTNYFGFTMMDMVSYERKYNDTNGEDNKDGNDYNCSWNCGIEGPSRKRQIVLLRDKQLRNAFAFLMLSQGTPLFFMGDEFGNSQKGNNNPYCQDNEITWLNWRDLHRNKALYEYVKELIAFRKAHGVFHMPKECMLMDYKSCGYPDLSYHGKEAWKPTWEHYSRKIGFMLCGEYAQECRGSFFYVAVNMFWQKQEFALPKLPKGKKWKPVLMTETEENRRESEDLAKESVYIVPARSIVVFAGTK